ncbi:hypothetical protein ACVZDL_09635 [Escherichia coli]
MKRLVLASLLAFSFGASAYSVNMEELTNFGNQMRDRFSSPHEIQKANNAPTCFAIVTNEKTGKITRTKLELVGEHSQKEHSIPTMKKIILVALQSGSIVVLAKGRYQ